MAHSSVSPPATPAPRLCGVCARPLPDRTGKRGQPARYCPPRPGEDRSACSRLADRSSLLAHTVREVLQSLVDADGSTIEAPSEEARRSFQRVKGFLWAETNSATNRGRLVGAELRKPYNKVRSGWWRNARTQGQESQGEGLAEVASSG